MNKDVENIIDGLLIKYPFFGSVIAGTKIIENNNCYYKLVYDPVF